ncbi:MAG: hypothetical protein JEZ06_07630 [Anaerolineaceae bacterium]|nr:hypothetical protein [Anaerolineaceae bacterium]
MSKNEGAFREFLRLFEISPLVFIIIVFMQFFAVFLTYSEDYPTLVVGIAGVFFLVVWFTIYIGFPIFWESISWLAMVMAVLLLGFVFYLWFGRGDYRQLIMAVLIAIVIIGSLSIAYQLIAGFFPGFLIGSIMFSLTENLVLSLIIFFLASIIYMILIYLIYNDIATFSMGFSWVWISISIANLLTIGLLFQNNLWSALDLSKASFTPISINFSTASNELYLLYFSEVGKRILMLFRAIFTLPKVMMFWTVLVSIFIANLPFIDLKSDRRDIY